MPEHEESLSKRNPRPRLSTEPGADEMLEWHSGQYIDHKGVQFCIIYHGCSHLNSG